MKSIEVYERKDIREEVAKEVKREFNWCYNEINKLRLRIIELEKMLKEKVK